MFFKKLKQHAEEEKEITNHKISNLSFEVSELYRTLRQLKSQVECIEIDMRTLQNKYKNKIYAKTEPDEQKSLDSEKFNSFNPFKL